MPDANWRRAYVPTKWEQVWVWNKAKPPPEGVEFFFEYEE
jgi:hypothetical protein